jgi:hypothetical protein
MRAKHLAQVVRVALVSQHESGRNCLNVYSVNKPFLADGTQPLELVPVAGHEEVLRHGDAHVSVTKHVRELIRVDEVQQSTENVWLHVVDAHHASFAFLHPRGKHAAEDARACLHP